MKRPIIAAIILSFVGATAAVAQPQNNYNNNWQGKPQQYNQSNRGPGPGPGAPGYNNRGAQNGPGYDNRGQRHSNWSKGKRLPRDYRGNVVRDYSRYRLPPPRRDQHWVRVNNEYLLIGITSGIIASLVQGR